MAVTQRQLAESYAGLMKIAQELREAARGKPLNGFETAVVPLRASGLRTHAEFLDRVAAELLELVDDEMIVEVPQ